MAKKPETIFKERVRAKLETLDNCWLVKINQVSIRGIPDFLICLNGGFVAIELKIDFDKARNKLQDWTLTCIAHAGGLGLVVTPDNWEETFNMLKDVSKPDKERDLDVEMESMN